MKKNIKKLLLEHLLNKYNKILSEKYKKEYILLEDIIDDLDSITSLQYECGTDQCDTYIECEFLKRYLYFKYIQEDLEDFEKMEGK